MVEYFTKKEYEQAKKSYRKLLIGLFIDIALYLGGSAVVLFWYLTLPYRSPTISTVKWVQYPFTAVFVIVTFIYAGIPLKRAKKYYRSTFNNLTGLREATTGSFFEYDERSWQKDGVDYKTIIFLEWSKYKKDFFERKVLVPFDKEFPKFEKHDNVRYVTQGNVLVAYEILE